MLGGVLAAILTCVCSQPLDAAGATRTRTAKATRQATPARKAPARVTRTAARKTTATRATASSKSRTTSAARRRAIARSRAATRAREARDLATPRFKLDDSGREVPAPRAAAAIIYDPETN